RAGNAEVAAFLVALVLSNVRWGVLQRVVRSVERIDLLESEFPAAGKRQRFIHLSAFDQIEKNVERRRPGPDTDGRTSLRQRLRNRESEAAIVRHTGDERTLACQVDREHENPGLEKRER